MDIKKILEINRIEEKEGPPIASFFRPGKVLVEAPDGGDNLALRLFDLLSLPAIRKGAGVLDDQVQKEYLQKIEFLISKGNPLELVFLGFPFKCHNPIETTRRTPDLGELAFLLRLVDIDTTVKQIYPPGARFVVLSESNAYKNLFGATSQEVEEFEKRLKYFVSRLGAGEIISFLDFISLCKQFPDFESILKEEEINLKGNRGTQNVGKEINTFSPVMIRSIPVPAGISLDDLLAVFGNRSRLDSLNDAQLGLLEKLSVEGEELAIRYLAFQKAKSRLGIISKLFPQSLYVSTTVKPDRFSFHPIHRRTRLYPHHGVPVLGSDKVDVVFFMEVLEDPENYLAVYCPDDIEEAPFYFLKGRQHLKHLKNDKLRREVRKNGKGKSKN